MWLRVMVNREAKGIAEQLAEETAEDKQTPDFPSSQDRKKWRKQTKYGLQRMRGMSLCNARG